MEKVKLSNDDHISKIPSNPAKVAKIIQKGINDAFEVTVSGKIFPCFLVLLVYLVPRAGIEPARVFYTRGILNPLRLPVSPPGLEIGG